LFTITPPVFCKKNGEQVYITSKTQKSQPLKEIPSLDSFEFSNSPKTRTPKAENPKICKNPPEKPPTLTASSCVSKNKPKLRIINKQELINSILLFLDPLLTKKHEVNSNMTNNITKIFITTEKIWGITTTLLLKSEKKIPLSHNTNIAVDWQRIFYQKAIVLYRFW